MKKILSEKDCQQINGGSSNKFWTGFGYLWGMTVKQDIRGFYVSYFK